MGNSDSIARAVSEGFCSRLRFGNRRNPLCISRFSNRSVGTKDPLSAAADWFRGSQDFQTEKLEKRPAECRSRLFQRSPSINTRIRVSGQAHGLSSDILYSFRNGRSGRSARLELSAGFAARRQSAVSEAFCEGCSVGSCSGRAVFCACSCALCAWLKKPSRCTGIGSPFMQA